MPQLLAIGRVARAHGIRGRVLIAPYNAGSEGLCRARRIWLGEREFEVDRAQRVTQGYLVALRGVGDRDQADALRGEEVRVDRAELPALEAGEMYAIDLIGYQVSDPQGTVRGVVEDLEEAGPQDLLRLDGGTLVPLALVTEVQPQARRIVVDAPEGLFDLEE
ncbi:MAG: 16S rRNA processing protein RimM [Deltaproteobacteria bacterium]|nr:MAG: 16S rRNA processing protein RimM [Deltaproteobacteria bacterium]